MRGPVNIIEETAGTYGRSRVVQEAVQNVADLALTSSMPANH
jgi:hypothetical protein